MHLTVTGYLTTAGRASTIDDAAASVLAGWSPDETRWLADLIEETPPGESWRRDHEHGWTSATAEG